MQAKTLLVIFVCVSAATAYTCPVTSCQTAGGTCADTTTTYYECDYGLYCGSSGTCVSTVGAGANCSSSGGGAECSENLSCNPNANGVLTCTAQYAGPGQACSSNGDCMYNNAPNGYGYNSTCQSGKCYGLASGATCTDKGQCNYGLYCGTGGTCTATLAAGATCTPGTGTDAPCSGALVCLPTDSSLTLTCQTVFSGTAGSYCYVDEMCNGGFYCNTTNSKCTAATTPSHTACTTDADCTNSNEVCGCFDNGQTNSYCGLSYTSYPANFGPKLNSYRTCVLNNPRCTLYQTCSQCSSQLCSIYKAFPSDVTSDTCGESPAEKSFLNNCNSSPISAVLSAAAVFAAICTLLMF